LNSDQIWNTNPSFKESPLLKTYKSVSSGLVTSVKTLTRRHTDTISKVGVTELSYFLAWRPIKRSPVFAISKKDNSGSLKNLQKSKRLDMSFS
jgi:hypothetical protein